MTAKLIFEDSNFSFSFHTILSVWMQLSFPVTTKISSLGNSSIHPRFKMWTRSAL